MNRVIAEAAARSGDSEDTVCSVFHWHASRKVPGPPGKQKPTDKRPTIKDLPKGERPRERLLSGGAEPLSDTELLAIIIGGGRRNETAVDLARRLLAKFGTFRNLDTATVGELRAVPGIGDAKAAGIKAALAIARRFASEPLTEGMKLRGSRDLFNHFREQLRDVKRETFWLVLLDQKHKIIRCERISEGSLSQSLVHPREVFTPAVRESAAAVAFVHNHPSGDPNPSPEDRAVTDRLKEVGELLGIKVLDHLIIGGDSYVSFAEQGML
ncbi:MAG: JAB domain-containing protein [Planctomycetes bacterium]|nr:JAB domain-containing protein [Planctomycetota bacterium]